MRGHAARRLFRVPSCRKGTIHLQTSKSSPGFEPKPHGSPFSVTNHYTGRAAFYFLKHKVEDKVSECTIRRHLQQSGLSSKPALLGLPMTQNHRRLLRQWCDERRICAAEWNKVVFTDEPRICLQHHPGRIRVLRHRRERMLNSCIMH
ncbi:transposable element Tcb1 transposase [Trichonephila clavipes]|nr:transposable element Tcb1 transposase [Trichonephila clavipes]